MRHELIMVAVQPDTKEEEEVVVLAVLVVMVVLSVDSGLEMGNL